MPKRALKRRPDGRYMCWYKGKCFYGNTSDEALKVRNEYKRLVENGAREESLGITVNQYAEQWVSIYKAEVSNGTYNAYVHYLNLACAAIGDMRMKDVTTTDIQSLYRQQIGKSGSHIRKFCATCKALFESALNDGVINRNPCAKSKRPYGDEGSHRVLEQWERDLVSSMVGKHDLSVAAMLMLYAGLRRGEVLAFNIDRDVDFKNGVIYVREAVAYDSNRPLLKATKTAAGMRDIPLFDPLRAALMGKHGLAISNSAQQMMSRTSFTQKWASYIKALETQLNGCHKRWYGKTKEHKAILSAGNTLPPWRSVTIRTHDFRHSFCSMLYNANVDLKTAMKWMGHADEKMILKIYAHLSVEKERESALSVGRMLNQKLYSQNHSQE